MPKRKKKKKKSRNSQSVSQPTQTLNMREKAPRTSETTTSAWQLRPNDGQGVMTQYFNNYVPRKVNPDFYEFLREGISIIDAAIQRLTELDGHITVTGNNKALVEEIQEWMDNVTVNDIQKGILAFDQNFTSEAHEQGFGISEYITNKKRTDIVGLRVADSKFIQFKRTNKGLDILQKANDDHDYRTLNPTNLMYFSINNENQNPYGTALLRSCEFVSKIVVTIENSMLNAFERFGDPAYQLIYKTGKKAGIDLKKRRKDLVDDLKAVNTAKRKGNSADFVWAIDKDSEITISVIGADNEILDFQVPMRIVLEQIVAKTGLPPWMLGLHWSTTERLSDAEANMLLAAVKTRQAAKMPLYQSLITNLLLLRGKTWKKGDWRLEWAQVNLHDIVKQAQAKFLDAQADMMRPENNDPAEGERSTKGTRACCGKSSRSNCRTSTKEISRPTAWPELDEVEDNFEKELKYDWSVLEEEVFTILKLPTDGLVSAPKPKPREEQLTKMPPPDGIPNTEVFTFSAEQRAAIFKALEEFKGKYDWRGEDSAVRWYYGQSYSLGLIQAANLVGKEQPILDLIKNKEVFNKIVKDGFTLVKDNSTKGIINKIIPEMEAQVLAGTNPRHVASRLKSKFGAVNKDWERLARTEMSMAAERAKVEEWNERGIDTGRAAIPGIDTHPRCRCANSIEEVNGKFVAVFVPAPDACPICLAAVT